MISRTDLDFGAVVIDDYFDKSFTITNTCGDTLRGNVSESCDHCSIVSGQGSFFLAPCDTLTVTVRFAPTSSGVRECTIETGNSLCSDVSCTGEGVSLGPEPAAVWVKSLDLPPGTTEFDLRVYLYNSVDLGGLSIPLEWDSPDISCDMVIFNGSRIEYLALKDSEIDNANQRVLVYGIVIFESPILAGSGLVFTIHFSVDPSASQQVVVVDTTFIPPDGNFILTDPLGYPVEVQFMPGRITLNNTAADQTPESRIKKSGSINRSQM